MIVVVVLVLTKHGSRVALVDDQEAVEEFAAEGADEAFGDGVACGARTGVLMIWMSVAVNTVSKTAVNLASWSRIRNRNRRPASSRFMQRLRASWVSHAPVGGR
jgi:hypothetical protein